MFQGIKTIFFGIKFITTSVKIYCLLFPGKFIINNIEKRNAYNRDCFEFKLLTG